MTERQLRLQGAGRRLFRSAALSGGVLGVFAFTTVMTGHQRLVFVILVGAIAMPLVLVGLALSTSGNSPIDARRLLDPVNVACMVGAAFINAVLFISPDAYAALALVAVSGALLNAGVQVRAPSRRASRLP